MASGFSTSVLKRAVGDRILHFIFVDLHDEGQHDQRECVAEFD